MIEKEIVLLRALLASLLQDEEDAVTGIFSNKTHELIEEVEKMVAPAPRESAK